MIEIYELKKDAEKIAKLIKKYPFDEEMVGRVQKILDDIKIRKDEALWEYTKMFDGPELESFMVSPEEIEEAYRKIQPEFISVVQNAIANIRKFHEKQLPQSWIATEEDGVVLGQKVEPVERAGLYVPGGTAAYPSSVLMNGVPAKVAGVKEIVMCAPPAKDGKLNPYTLVAANEVGIQEIWKLGGAQAVGAMAYGSDTLKCVDKITGPGNIYVTIAKKLVYGVVDIDMLAGPSEIMILANDDSNPAYLAADLLSQAEHDTLAAALLVTTSRSVAEAVRDKVREYTKKLPRKEIILQALQNRGGIILVESMDKAVEVVNTFAPEHLEISVANPFPYLGKIKNAGAIFLGEYTPEPVGDYYAGPNHVLPTGGTARFYSPLGVEDFLKKSSIIYYSKERLSKVGEEIALFANVEGLGAHEQAVRVRLEGEKRK
jgi:histidinol dehydrogenase